MNERFYSEYTRALREGTAALFAGAGLSVPAGYVDWKKLLRPLAEQLRLDVDQETDLPALAQFSVNEEGGRRTAVSQRILEDLTREAELTPSHRLLAGLPIRTVWTTNYDDLLEKSFTEAGKRPDVKRRETSLTLTRPDADVTLYKMHGDITEPEKAVLTQDDYESYSDSRQLFTTTLQAELATKTFLFLGFSFTDTNLGHILGPGIREEFDIAVREGSRPIPVAATGHGAPVSGAVDLWNEVMGRLAAFYPEGGVESFFKVLGDPSRSNDELLQAIFGIIDRVTRP